MGERRIVLEVAVSEDVAELAERHPWLGRVIAWKGLEWASERLQLVKELDSLTQGIDVDEEAIIELDRVLKRGIARRLDARLGLGGRREKGVSP